MNTNLLDTDVPNINIPTMTPTRAPRVTLRSRMTEFKNSLQNKVKEFNTWIVNKVPQPIRTSVSKAFTTFKNKITSLYKTTPTMKRSETSLHGFSETYTIEAPAKVDSKTFLTNTKALVLDLWTSEVEKKKGLKTKLILECVMVRTTDAGDVEATAMFHSLTEIILEGTDLDDVYNKSIEKIQESLATYLKRGSSWRVLRVVKLDIFVDTYKPLGGSSYIPTPAALVRKKAIINIQNKKDHECGKWSITVARMLKQKNAERLTEELRRESEKFDWSGISFPMALMDIKKFSKNNKIHVNVFAHEEKVGVYPLLVLGDSKDTINLLLITREEDDGTVNSHYTYIKDMSRLMAGVKTKHHGKTHYCYRCLNSFTTKGVLEKHNEYCSSVDSIKTEMPEKDSTVKFKNNYKTQDVPFVIYADFESFIEPISTCTNNPENSSTTQYQHHTPSGFCFHLKCFDDELHYEEPVLYTKQNEDDNIGEKFVMEIEKTVKNVYEKFKVEKAMIYESKDKFNYNNSETCWLCNEDWSKLTKQGKPDYKVRDHCHLTGKFRGAAHNSCNLKHKLPKFVPVIFHNLAGYDAHLFVKSLGVTDGEIHCIPNNQEKYISFSKDIIVDTLETKDGDEKQVKREIRFLDSFKFMASSLDKLVKNLDKKSLTSTKKVFGKDTDLLSRKGVFPYEHMTGLPSLNETSLPPKEKFHSKLTDSGISDKDYTHAKEVWKRFNMTTLRDYHDLYLKTDVTLLEDVFENFRETCQTHYTLDPAFYFTSPGLSWDALLKTTGIELDLLTDIDMLLMVESGIRGGISTIIKRHAKANNMYMNYLKEKGLVGLYEYDMTKPSVYLPYLDANNLYGWAMSLKLPTGNFKWMTNVDQWRDVPCILEVDLEYPVELHDFHNEYPLAPERVLVNGVEKLIPNLNNKTKYVLHKKNLEMYLRLGMKLTKIHRGLTFDESAWMRPYIELNTQLRTQATNEFEKDFFKLMNNSVFGKTMENIRNRVNIQLVTTEKKMRKLVAKPNYHHRTIFNENLVAVHMKRTKVIFDKPVYLGMIILDLSKTLMYKFHYDYIKPKYGDDAKLLFTDTDSLMYEIHTEDFYKDISEDVEKRFDTSAYGKDHPSCIPVGLNKKVLGMMKDEYAGEQVLEFVGLRSKLYACRLNEITEKKCKGVKKSVVKKDIIFNDYLTCLQTRKSISKPMNTFRSRHHEIFTERINKTALSSDDDKRHILENGVDTLALGHWNITNDK